MQPEGLPRQGSEQKDAGRISSAGPSRSATGASPLSDSTSCTGGPRTTRCGWRDWYLADRLWKRRGRPGPAGGGCGWRPGGDRAAAAGADRGAGRRRGLGLSGPAAGCGVRWLRPVLRADLRLDAGHGDRPGGTATAGGAAVRLGVGERARGTRPDRGHRERGGGALPHGAAAVLRGRGGARALRDRGLDGGFPAPVRRRC